MAEGGTMLRHYKKPPVRPEVGRKWLQRHEEEGQSVAQIAKADGYDVRTVRRQLDLMKQEREVREARQTVLRNALEKHFQDLADFAEKLKGELSGNTPVAISHQTMNNPLLHAFKQHLPRLGIWREINNLPELVNKYEQAKKELHKHLITELQKKTSLKFVIQEDEIGLLEGLIEAAIWHLKEVACGNRGLEDIAYNTSKKNRMVRIKRGAFYLANTDEDKTTEIKAVFDGILSDAQTWQAYDVFKRFIEQFLKIKGVVNEEMTKIMLRRIVPGRCSYCPL
jgi:hypothetical protein